MFRLFILISTIILLLLILLNYNSLYNYFNSNIKKTESNANYYGEVKKINITCRINDEIINRDNVDNERECYYKCINDEIVRVDTSIGFPCEKFIIEEREGVR